MTAVALATVEDLSAGEGKSYRPHDHMLNPTCLLLSDRPDPQAACCVVPFLGHSGKDKTTGTENIGGNQGLGVWGPGRR